MTLRSNHDSGLLVARSLTTVGSTRVSMGPAMSVSVRGTAGFPASAITAVAASAATHGWQTAITWVSGPRTSSQRMRCSTYESKPKLPCAQRDVAGVVPVGDPHVLLGEQRAHGAAQQRGEVTGERRDERAPSGSGGGPSTSPSASFLKWSSVPNGVTSVASSVTTTSRRPTLTESMPHGGRSWVRPTRPSSSYPAVEVAHRRGVGECRAEVAQLTETLQSNPRDARATRS